MSEEREPELENHLVSNENEKNIKIIANTTDDVIKDDKKEIDTSISRIEDENSNEDFSNNQVNSEPPASTETHEDIKDLEIEGQVKETAEKNLSQEYQKDKSEEENIKITSTVPNPDSEVLEEIDQNNAEDAEDTDNQQRHEIPLLDYHSMSMENLTGEFQKLVRNEKVQAIKKHVDSIKHEFDLKFQDFLEHKKEEFIANGGNEIDFRYNSVIKKQFNEVYAEYREKKNSYYNRLEKSLKENLTIRLALIEELKGLVNVEEDINTTYKNFKDVQERWRNAGPIPRSHYNNVWKTYQHHIEIFYDFLHLNRELRDLDFKHNLEEKQKLVVRAQALATDPDLNRAFRELQALHKIWKEDIGPVGKEHREQIWDLFSAATKVLHQRRQEYFREQDKVYEQNLIRKQEIIEKIKEISSQVSNNHNTLQQQIKQIEDQREAFFKAGKVPQKVNEQTWAAFKEAVRTFNRNKNAFYKKLKKEQQENLDKKQRLLALAISLKDNEDWDATTQEMKRIQSEWKKIGHVPRKYSDKIWKEFKSACNHYFDRFHATKNKANEEEVANLEKKEACLESLKTFELSGNKGKDIAAIKTFIAEWKVIGRVPFNKKHINQKFNKILDAIFKKLEISRQESELLKYGNKIQELSKSDDEYAISNERTFIRKKIEESKSEIRQLENNLLFFSNTSEENPIVRDVVKRVEEHKKSLETWKIKLKKLNILENNRNKTEDPVVEEENKNESEK